MTDLTQQPSGPAAPPSAPSLDLPPGGTFQQIAQSAELRMATDSAGEQGDWQAYDRGMLRQRQDALMANMMLEQSGQSPLTSSHPIALHVHPLVEIDRRMMAASKQRAQMVEALQTSPWGEITQFLDGVIEQYREHNDAELVKRPQTQEEFLQRAQQLRPVQVDPNLVADMRAKMLQVDQAMKAVDPTASVWTHPQTKNYAEWINREAGGGGIGFMQSGEQEMELGVVGTAAMAGMEGMKGLSDFGLALINGTWEYAGQGIRAVGGPDIGPLFPTNYVRGPDGKVYDNGGKIPDVIDAAGMGWFYLTNQNVEQKMAELGRARELEEQTRNGLDSIVLGGSRVFGMGFGFGLPSGVAMTAGAKTFQALGSKGLHWLASGGRLTKAAGLSAGVTPRAAKITSLLSGAIGGTIAQGIAEGAAYGNAQGFGQAFMGGMLMAPVMVTIGAMGRGTERLLRGRANMPGPIRTKLAQALGGVVEGGAFATFEQLGVDGALWNFLKDPSGDTLNTYLSSMTGFMLFKMAGRPMLSQSDQLYAEVAGQVQRGRARTRFAEQAAEGTVPRETVERKAAEVGVPAEALTRLGQLSRAARETRDPRERQRLEQEIRDLEGELDVAELGQRSPAERDVEAVRQGEPEDFAKRELQERFERRVGERRQRMEEAGVDPLAPERTPEATLGLGKLSREQAERIEAERAAGAAGRPETREKIIREYQDPLERADFDSLPEGLRTRILEASDAFTRKELYLEAAQERAKTATTPEARKRALADFRRLEAAEAQRDVRPIGENLELEVRESRASAAAHEWLIRDREGNVVGHGQFHPQGRKADIWSAEILPEHRGKGLYSEVLRELAQRFPEGLGSPGERTPAAVRAWQRAGLTEKGQLAERRGGERREPEGELQARMGRERKGGSFDYGPERTRQSELREGEQRVDVDQVYEIMEGKAGRKGLRIPFTAKRVGTAEGDPVRVPFRAGKIGAAGVEGTFDQFANLARTKEGRDVIVGSHEWSHALHRHMLEQKGEKFIRSAREQFDEAIDQSRRMDEPTMAKDGKLVTQLEAEVVDMLEHYGDRGAAGLSPWRRWAETWAEWNARNLLGDPELRARFPAISRFIDQQLVQWQAGRLMREGSQYLQLQTALDRYRRQGALGRAREGILRAADPSKDTWRQRLGEGADKVVRGFDRLFLDDLAEMKRSQQFWLDAVGGKLENVSILDNPARLLDALKMTAWKTMEHHVNDGLRAPDGSRVRPLKQIMSELKESGKARDFETYLVEVRNAQLFKRGKESMRGIEDHLEAIRQLVRGNPEFVRLGRELKAWSDRILDYVVDAGALDLVEATRIKDAYALYVPFFRAIEGPRRHQQGRGVAEGGTGLRTIKGDTHRVKDPLQNLISVGATLISKAHQNMVMQALYNMANRHELGGLATVVPRKNVPQDHPVKQVLDALERDVKLPGDQQHLFEGVLDTLRSFDALSEQAITLFSQPVVPVGQRAIIAFTPRMTQRDIDRVSGKDRGVRDRLQRQTGKVQWLEVDTKTYEALMGLDIIPSVLGDNIVGQTVRFATKMVRLGATGLSVPFMFANAARDILSAPVFDREGKFRPFGGFKDFATGAQDFHQNRSGMRELYERLGVKTSSFFDQGTRRSILQQSRTTMQKLWSKVEQAEALLATPENYLRMTAFRRAYEKAVGEGKSQREAELLALEAGREITVNFARAGVYSRLFNQMTPYFNASIQGQRKLWRQLLVGGDAKSDAERAKIQRAAFANAFTSITVPSLILWAINKDEEWYQDLPEWRKVGFFNVHFGEDGILSIPRPFELGVLFGGLAEVIAEEMWSNPGNRASMGEVVQQLLLPYLKDPAAAIPAFIKPTIEVGMGQNIFTQRPLTPDWIERTMRPEEQATFRTTESAKILSRAIGGFMSPIEIEHWLGSHTADMTTKAMRVIDEIANWKDHPGFELSPVNRFFRQTEHGQSRFVDELYDASTWLQQREDGLDTMQRGLMRRIESAKRQMSSIMKAYRAGDITRDEADSSRYELARPLVEEFRRRQ